MINFCTKVANKTLMFHFADWTARGTTNTLMNFDIDSTPLQILTDSLIGSGDAMRPAFVGEVAEAGSGLMISFTDPPAFAIGNCTNLAAFTLLGTDKYRIWTIIKHKNTLQVLSDGVEIFNFNFTESHDNCRRMWSQDFDRIQFLSADTASEYFRNLPDGKFPKNLGVKTYAS